MDRKSAVVPFRSTRPGKLVLTGNAWRLLMLSTINSLALSAVGSLMTPYLRDLGLSAAFVGSYFAVSALVQGCASFAGGFMADSFGRRRIWILGKVFQLLAYAVLAAGLRGEAIIAVAALSGLSQIGIGAMMALQADATQASWRATFFAIIQTANSLIGAVAPLLGGLVADRYGATWAFLGVLPLLVLVARLISQLEEKVAERPAAGATPVTHPAGIGGRLAAARLRLAALAQGVLHGPYPRTALAMLGHTLVNGISNGAISIGLPLLLKERFAMGYTGVGAMNTVAALGSATCMILGARLADRYGRRKMIIASSAACAGIVWLVPSAASALHLYILVFLATLAGNSANGAFSATNMECIDAGSRATYAGVNQGLNSIGMAVGSVTAGIAYGWAQMAPMVIAASAISVTALLMVLFLEETGTLQSAAKEAQGALAASGSSE